MLSTTKSAATNPGQRSVRISDWRPLDRNTLKGAFTVVLPSGLIIHDVMVHEKNGERWLSFPAKEWEDARGNRQFARFIGFADRATSDRFRDQVLAALAEHLKERQ
jgi:hypothetical protein